MGYLCALLLAVGVSYLGTIEQKKEVENWSGLIRKSSLAKLPGRTDVKVKATSFTYGVFADAKSFKAFADAAFPRHGADISLDPARLLAGNIDWDKDVIVYVIRTAPTNYVRFDSWQASKDGRGTLRIRFSAIEPYYYFGSQYPGVFCRLPKTGLNSLSLLVDKRGWQDLGNIVFLRT